MHPFPELAAYADVVQVYRPEPELERRGVGLQSKIRFQGRDQQGVGHPGMDIVPTPTPFIERRAGKSQSVWRSAGACVEVEVVVNNEAIVLPS
jgi:hypothetical protein